MNLQSADKSKKENELNQIWMNSKKKIGDLGQKFSNLDQLAIQAIEKIWNQDKQFANESL